MRNNRKSRRDILYVITPRDVRILQKLNAASWLTSKQIQLYFFPGRSTNAVCKRLRKLTADRFIAIARVGSTEPALYRLSSRGRLALIEQYPEKSIHIPTQVPRKLRHFIAVNDLRCCFERSIPEAQLRFFFSEQELARFGNADSLLTLLKHHRIIPDAIAKLALTGNSGTRDLILCLEYDEGTETGSFFGQTKVKRYISLFEQNHSLLKNLKVITVARTIRRLVTLMKQVTKWPSPENYFYFALHDKLSSPQLINDGILLNPDDYFIATLRGRRLEIGERDIGANAPKWAIANLPPTCPRKVSLRGDKSEFLSSEDSMVFEEDGAAVS